MIRTILITGIIGSLIFSTGCSGKKNKEKNKEKNTPQAFDPSKIKLPSIKELQKNLPRAQGLLPVTLEELTNAFPPPKGTRAIEPMNLKNNNYQGTLILCFPEKTPLRTKEMLEQHLKDNHWNTIKFAQRSVSHIVFTYSAKHKMLRISGHFSPKNDKSCKGSLFRGKISKVTPKKEKKPKKKMQPKGTLPTQTK